VARGLALAAALAAFLLAVPGAGGSGAQAPRFGGELVFGTQAAAGGLREPPCLNVLLEKRCITTGVLTPYIAQKVLLGAFDAGLDGNWRPRLVSGADVTRSRPFTITYRIRREARWSDRVPVTARDFVFTDSVLRALRDEQSTDWYFQQVRSVRAVDAKTVRVVLRSRFGGWRGLFAAVLPSHALIGRNPARIWTDGIDNPKTGAPIGSGPFLVARWDRGTQIVLRRNPGFWGRRPRLDRIVIRYRMRSPEPRDWLQSGEVDVAHHFSLVRVPELRQIPGITVVPGPTSNWEHLTLNVGRGGHPALERKAVRQALAYGLDRVALIRGSPLGGADPALRPLDSVVFLPQSPYYRPNWSRYRHNPRLARQLLEGAGCRRSSDDIYVCDAQRLRLRLAVRQGLPTAVRIAELVRDQLREIGVEVVLEFAPPSVVTGQIITSGDFDLVQFAWFSPVPDPGSAHGLFGCEAEQNFGGYCQRLLTHELEEAMRTLNAADQARVLNRADAQLARDVPIIPLAQTPFPAAISANVRNFSLSPFNPLATAEDWWLASGR
jgi:peptide/nickel transport system substrate-binding protein